MAGDPAELAFGHALAMLGDPDAAVDVASTALRRAGRSRDLVLAHTRQLAVERAAADEPVDIAGLQIVVLDLPALAATLASTRPPQERAALDVRTRTGGDLPALGAGLGMRPTAAADKCNEIAEEWERTLDPALLAFAGPGDCEALAGILPQADSTSVADLLALAPSVHAHALDCTACTDRRRAMASVRSFFSGGSVHVPAEVREVGHVSRRRRPAAAPPPLFESASTPAPGRGRSRRLLFALGGLATALIAAGVAVVWTEDDNEAAPDLTALSANSLLLSELNVSGDVARVRVLNPSSEAISYRATSSANWTSVSPEVGRLGAGESVQVVVRALEAAPEGESRTRLTFTTSDGSTMTTELRWSLEHPPDVDATAQACSVDVHVVEEGELESLVLHWRDATEHSLDITSSPDMYRAELKPEGVDITYWVTAVDGRGNESRTPDRVIPVGAC